MTGSDLIIDVSSLSSLHIPHLTHILIGCRGDTVRGRNFLLLLVGGFFLGFFSFFFWASLRFLSSSLVL
jgi:hypothetical protein